MALTALEVRGPWSRAAAEAALVGADAAVIAYATDGWKKANEQDERQQVNQIAQSGDYDDVRKAAVAALAGTAADVRAFLATGQYQAAAPDRRIEVARIAEAGGPGVKDAASVALKDANPKALELFLATGQHRARLEDDRVEAARLAEGGTPELKAAAETALASPDTLLRTFIESGQHRAKRRDQLNAAHVAEVKAIIAAASQVSALAYQDAYKAAKSAADAQGYADEASGHAKKADEYAAKANGYATQARQSADEARRSSDAAAGSAATATKAERQAADSAERAESSATAAYASSLAAADYAESAYTAAEQARVSAANAGMSAQEAQVKHQQTVQRYMIDEYNKEVQRQQAEAAEAKKRSLIKIGVGILTFAVTGQLPPDTPLGVRLDVLHGLLDVIGLIPGIGEVADGANCAIYAIEGTVQYFHPIGREGAWIDAGLACASMIPVAGWATTPAKWARYAEKYGPDVKKAFDDLSDLARKTPGVCPVRGNSFPAGTRVLMGDRSAKPIQDVQEGDFVLATDPVSGLTGPRRVVATIYTPDDRDFTDVTLEGDRAASVTATDHHPFWTENTRTWTDAAEVEVGDTLRTASGAMARVGSVRHWKTLQPAYNLTVDDLHTYYVLAGRTPVLVHNTNGPVPCPRVPWLSGRLPAAEEAALNDTLAHIAAGTVPTGPTSIKWGTKFNNRAVDLPGGVGEHSPYLEYRVAPPPGTSGAGPLRVVRHQYTGETYYTWTHYGDNNVKPAFVRVR
ncbi:hypothetical protein LG634_06710 [Streptomyces bambusae]|nr:hypothetical protein [Streptomyces bambusae]